MGALGKINLLSQGGICKIVIDIIRTYMNDVDICIFDDSPKKNNTSFNGIVTNNSISNFINNASNKDLYFNCIGNINAMKMRIKYSLELQRKGLLSSSIIHPNSYISKTANIENGNLVCPNVVINTNAKIGKENIIFSNTVIEHDSIIGNLCYLSPSVTICGKVFIDDYVYIGPNATLTAGVKIGQNSIIGAGSVVLHDIPPNTVYVGNPAKFLKQNLLW